MGHYERALLLTLIVSCSLALALLAAAGFVMLWVMFKQPAKWKLWRGKFDRLLVAKRLLPGSFVRALNRFDNPALERSLVGAGLILSVAGLCIGIRFLCLSQW